MKELNTIQTKLNAPKDLRNTFGGYNYRSCESILEALKPLLAETECTLTLVDEIVFIGDRFYVKATATLKNANGETESAVAYAREEESKKGMDASQLTGATSSYARKYALSGLFAIDDNKDADATNKGDNKANTKTETTPSTKTTKKGETKQEPLSNEDDVILQDAIQAAKDAKTASELTKVWKDFKPKFEHNEAFVNAIKSNPNYPSRKK